jgi:hypothetical protein
MTETDQLDSDQPSARREFLAQLALAGFALTATSCASHVNPPPASAAPAPTPPSAVQSGAPPVPLPPTANDGPWDMTWLDRLAGARFKLVFDIGAYQNGGGLYYARNYLNGMRDGWGVETPGVIAVLGISGDAYPIIFNDVIWAKYKFGESSKTKDPRTGQFATRNVWWQPRQGEPMAEFGVDLLQRRGAQFVFCNNVFRGVIRRLMAQTGGSYGDVRGELSANFLPGVVVVPAMVAAMGMAQAHGCGYVYAGA